MSSSLYILFCESPFQSGRVDEDFEDQYVAAKEVGLGVLLFNFEDLTSIERRAIATRRIKPNDVLAHVIYRGWMLTPQQYDALYQDLLAKNFKLINTAEEYQNCHYLPDSLKFIESDTPRTVFEKFNGEASIDALIKKTSIFGEHPVILKDYVKSEKHDWETACFVPNASDTGKLKQSILKLIELRGSYLNEGIVVREFVHLKDLATHSKSGMPLKEEYRLFFYHQKLLGIYDYWEEGEYRFEKPNTSRFEEIAKQIPSNFFSMDIARQENETFVIIELGDGQVAGLPNSTDRHQFYQQLLKN